MIRNFRIASGGIVGADPSGSMYSRGFTNYEIGKTMGEEHILICILTYASENARNNAIATAHDQRPATALPISAMRLLLRGLRIALARFFPFYRENREDIFFCNSYVPKLLKF